MIRYTSLRQGNPAAVHPNATNWAIVLDRAWVWLNPRPDKKASAPSIVRAEARVNQLCSFLVRWADGKQLAIAPQKSSVTLFTSDTHQSRLHPQVQIGDPVAPLNRTPKILSVTLDAQFTFGPHARDCVERASRAH